MERYIVKMFKFLVDTGNTTYNKKFDLDKNIVLVHGIAITSDKPNLAFYRGGQRIEINGDEIFPEDYDTQRLLCGLSVPLDNRYYTLGSGVVAGNGEVKILYRDTENTYTGFSPYEIRLHLKCEIR